MQGMDGHHKTSGIFSPVPRVLVLAFFWWVLTAAEPSSWLVGAPVVAAATFVSVRFLPLGLRPWRVAGLCRFVPTFLWLSLRGGIDVAGRALHPHLPIAPCVLEYALRLSDPITRVFFANTVSLLPGTLSADVRGDSLTVHSLAGSEAVDEELTTLEALVAGLVGEELPPSRRTAGHSDV